MNPDEQPKCPECGGEIPQGDPRLWVAYSFERPSPGGDVEVGRAGSLVICIDCSVGFTEWADGMPGTPWLPMKGGEPRKA